jgi:hypothetical protein
MWVDFDSLPASSRVWIYQANRPLSKTEQDELMNVLHTFCESWATHGQPMKASARLEFDQFIVLVADEDFQQPSGCSIDSSVRSLKEWQVGRNVDLFDRTSVPVLEGGQIRTLPLSRLKSQIAEGLIAGSTLTLDNLVPSKGDWQLRWKTPIEKTWLAKYLPESALKSTT